MPDAGGSTGDSTHEVPGGGGPQITVARPDGPLWRVARPANAIRFSEITALDANEERAGNRFDVPGGGVLYCATHPIGAFTETLVRLRPTKNADLLKAVEEDLGHHQMPAGGIPADWRDQRRKVRVAVAENTLPFADVESEDTRAALSALMPDLLKDFRIPEIDVSVVRGPNRLITRAIARYLYEAADEDGNLRYGGLRYLSKYGDHECWAIFDGAPVRDVEQKEIRKDDDDLKDVASRWGLTMH